SPHARSITLRSDLCLFGSRADHRHRHSFPTRRSSDLARMLQALGWRTLQEEVERLGGADAPDTRLHVDLAGRDPDEGMTEIPYEKGAAFLRTIEAAEIGRASCRERG